MQPAARQRGLELETELLLALWQLSDDKTICFVSFDLEGPFEAITELGLAFRRKDESRRGGRHIIVKCNQHKKRSPPRPCGFGITSEEVDKPEELDTILDDFFKTQRADNHRVVLTGFDMKVDLCRLDRDCGWRLPTSVMLMDTATIFRTLTGRSANPNLATSLETFGFITKDPTAPFHNAANDAWYTLELLFRKAEQAQRRHEALSSSETIDGLVPTKTTPPSPMLRGTSTARLSCPFDFSDEKPPRPPSHQPSQATQRLFSSTTEAALAQRPSKKRRRRGGSQKGGLGETVDATSLATPAHNRPQKRQKLMEETPNDGPAVQREQPELRAMDEGQGVAQGKMIGEGEGKEGDGSRPDFVAL